MCPQAHGATSFCNYRISAAVSENQSFKPELFGFSRTPLSLLPAGERRKTHTFHRARLGRVGLSLMQSGQEQRKSELGPNSKSTSGVPRSNP